MKKLIVCVTILFFLSFSVWSQKIEQCNNKQTEQLSFDGKKRLHGECRAWNQNGVLIGIANYKHGKKDGVWKIYYDNGKLAYEMWYYSGQKVGLWQHWDENGVLIKEKNYNLYH